MIEKFGQIISNGSSQHPNGGISVASAYVKANCLEDTLSGVLQECLDIDD